jgi:hypothetical protein
MGAEHCSRHRLRPDTVGFACRPLLPQNMYIKADGTMGAAVPGKRPRTTGGYSGTGTYRSVQGTFHCFG